ncbi:amidohydrolase [Nitratireductor sp. ZSWI3]|uniref:amidohydrolase n=1 Tax=Nitratireductor sp. ZSWI3 TaxID=2966359 RepID=UPI00214FB5C4|nr:amidohydrolase [Nitratireductor sp. ZSWI3]MCR4265229.1 amidohydrolase [Nitratireductor sp. ZSWI3]
MKNSERIWDNVETHKDDLIGMSDRVWGTPELLYGEFESVAEHTAMLRQKGFAVEENVAGIPTAVTGIAGEGGPLIAFLGEYDALPGLSQVAGLAEPKELENGGNGHGCGHNLLGGAALLAAVALKDWLEETGTPGRVMYAGCPAEEGGGAKSFMAREGVFKDVDIALTWHPGNMTHVDDMLSLANTRIDFTFTGRPSHAAASPHLGRSALDAAQLMCVGVNYLREHMPDSDRIHYAYLDTGGTAPNVVHGTTTVRYVVRSRSLSGMRSLIERVKKCAEGAAIMTETKVESKVLTAVSNMLDNQPLARAMRQAMDTLGGVPFDDRDAEFARQIRATLSPEEIAAAYTALGRNPEPDEVLCDYITDYVPGYTPMMGSTDVADVSWQVPTIQARVATHAVGTTLHTWQATAQGKSGIAHKGMVHAAKILAHTAVKTLTDPTLVSEAKAYHRALLEKDPYVCPIPADTMPPLKPRPASKMAPAAA